jgi:hypothetical protein
VTCPSLKKLVKRGKIFMTGERLKQYTEARINERLHLFLQFPDLRRSFQEIDRKDLAYYKACRLLREEHNKAKYSPPFISQRNLSRSHRDKNIEKFVKTFKEKVMFSE